MKLENKNGKRKMKKRKQANTTINLIEEDQKRYSLLLLQITLNPQQEPRARSK